MCSCIGHCRCHFPALQLVYHFRKKQFKKALVNPSYLCVPPSAKLPCLRSFFAIHFLYLLPSKISKYQYVVELAPSLLADSTKNCRPRPLCQYPLTLISLKLTYIIDITVRDGKLKFLLNQNVLRDVTSRWSMRITARSSDY